RVDGKVARGLDALALVAGGGELAGVGVNGEDGDAVVPAVRAVEKLARRVDHHLRRVAGPLEVLRQRRDRLDLLEGALVRVIVERGDRVGHLVDDVGVAPLRVEGEMARSGAGGDGAARRVVRL